MRKCSNCGGYYHENDADNDKYICNKVDGKPVPLDMIVQCPHCGDATTVVWADVEYDEYYAAGTPNGYCYMMASDDTTRSCYKEGHFKDTAIVMGEKQGDFRLIHKVVTPDNTEAIELWGNDKKKEVRQFFTDQHRKYRFCGNLVLDKDYSWEYWLEEWPKCTDYYKKEQGVLN